MSFINPIDLTISLIILVIIAFGFNNGFIIELKKTINLFLSLFLAKIITQFFLLNNFLGIANSVYLIILLIVFLFIIGFLLDIAIINLPNIHIDKYADKLIASLLSIIKGFLIISIVLFMFNSSPIQKNIKEKIYLKASSKSISFKICKNIQELLTY
tara:strand:+ start:639 stop:1109 length:471 start_codon:yes stop_codon:yes gene_type:complete